MTETSLLRDKCLVSQSLCSFQVYPAPASSAGCTRPGFEGGTVATGLQASAVCKCVHADQPAGYAWSNSPELDFCCLVSQGNQRRLWPLLGPRKHVQAVSGTPPTQGLQESHPQALLAPQFFRLLTTLSLQQAICSLPFELPYCERPSFNGTSPMTISAAQRGPNGRTHSHEALPLF